MSARYGVTFLILAVLIVLAGLLSGHWPAYLVAGDVALAFVLLTAAYLGGGPRLLLKRPDGAQGLHAWVLFWPYFLLNLFSFWLYRRSSREPACAEIVPHLHLGRRLTAREIAQAGQVRWRAVLDLAAEFAESAPLRQRLYHSLPVLDATAPSWQQLQVAVAWLQEQVPAGPVFVHCAFGHGRSATVVIAYLLATRQAADIEQAVRLLRERKRSVALCPQQKALLRRYAQALNGEGGS